MQFLGEASFISSLLCWKQFAALAVSANCANQPPFQEFWLKIHALPILCVAVFRNQLVEMSKWPNGLFLSLLLFFLVIALSLSPYKIM